MAERFQDKDNRPAAAPGSVPPADTKKFPGVVLILPVLLILGIGAMIYRGQHDTKVEGTPVLGTEATGVQRSGKGGVETPQSKSFDTLNTNATNPAANIPGAAMPNSTHSDNTNTPAPDPVKASGAVPSENAGASPTPAAGSGETASALPGNPEFRDLKGFGAVHDRSAYIGRKAKLTNVKVRKVVSDRGFFVGSDDTDQVLVFLDRALNDGKTEQHVQIQAGQTVSLDGDLKAVPTQEVLNEQYEFKGKDYSDLQKQSVYLHAKKVQFK